VAQAIMVLALPVLTRLYSPNDFSLLAGYAAILSMATIVSCLRFNIAITFPEDDLTAMNLLVIALMSSVAIAILLVIPSVFFAEWCAQKLGQPGLKPYLWLLPLGVFFAAAYDALQYWASRKKRISSIARTRMTRVVTGVGAQLGMGLYAIGPIGLLLGHMLLNGSGFIGLARDLWKSDRAQISDIQLSHLRTTAQTYRQFPLYSLPEALLNTAGNEIPILIIASMAVGPEAGYLMLAMRIIGIPMALIGASVSQIFLTLAPERHLEGSLSKFTKQTMLSLLKVGGAPILIFGIVSPSLFPLIFGAEWTRSGVILAMLTPMFILQFIISPITGLPLLVGKAKIAMWLQLVLCIMRIGIVWLCASYIPVFIIESLAVSGILYYSFMLVFLWFFIVRRS
jgi:O-antigen/teichoic acid export membrane protein